MIQVNVMSFGFSFYAMSSAVRIYAMLNQVGQIGFVKFKQR